MKERHLQRSGDRPALRSQRPGSAAICQEFRQITNACSDRLVTVCAMKEWLDTNPQDLTDDQLVARIGEVEVLRTRLDAAEMATIQEWDARQVWAADGAKSGGAWLAGHTGMASSTGREKVRVARALRHMPRTTAEFNAGHISYAKVRVLTKAAKPETLERFEADEEMLVGYARTFGVDDLEKLIAHWLSVVDPDGADQEASERWERRGASLADVMGTGYLKATMDPESHAIFRAELEALMWEMTRSDARDHEQLGIPPRSTQQRRLDALVEMATRSASSAGGRAKAEIIVMVDYQTYLAGTGTAELARSGRISGEALRRLGCEAGIVRAVVAGQSEILDLGRSTPVPNAAQRRAAKLRYQTCAIPGCDVPEEHTQLHHLIWYRRGQPLGGTTDADLLVPACTHHHHLVHEGQFQLTIDIDTNDIHFRRADGTVIAQIHPNGPITRRPQLVGAIR